MKKSVQRLLTLAVLAGLAGSTAQAQETKVLSLNSAEGIRATMDQTPTRTVTVEQGTGNSTDGDGALRVKGTSITRDGNRYFGIMVPLGRTWDLTKARLAVDARTSEPGNTGAFYVRAYNQGETQASLSFASWNNRLKTDWNTFHFQYGGRGSDLSWEAAVVGDRVPNKVDRLEFIIGTGEKGVPIDLQIDNLRLVPPIQVVADLSEPKKLQRNIPVVENGNAVATVYHPDSAAGRAEALRIVEAVKTKTGATLTARVATEADREFKGNAILLGNATNNPALFLLYTRHFTPVDALCPGAGGSLVQTVHDPFGQGNGAVVVGASDDAGLKAAATAFIAQLPQDSGRQLNFARLFKADYGRDFLRRYGWAAQKEPANRYEQGVKAANDALSMGRHTSIAGELRQVAQRYQLTASPTEARLFVALWDIYVKSAVADPSKFGGPWGFDSDFPSYEVVSGWDNIEEDAAITDEERLRVTKSMARWLTEAVIPKTSPRGRNVLFNHQTFPGLGVLRAGLYFQSGYPKTTEGRDWLAQADRLFQIQQEYFKPYEDCNTYQWLTTGHVLRYAIARPDFTVFKNGNAERITDYAIATMNNLGYQVPYGDTGVWSGSSSENVPLSITAFITGNRAAAWAAELKNSIRGSHLLYNFQQPYKEPVPQNFNGVQLQPLDPAYASTFQVAGRPADNQLFDKVSFREQLDKEAPYLLLDGLNNGGHGHVDGNSIEQLTQFDRIWLADNDYFKTHVKYHNSMQVLRNGQASALPAYAALLGHGQTDDFGYSHSRLENYSSSNWDRYIVRLRKSDAFVVLDKVTALEDGEYQCRLLWHGVGEAKLTDDGMLLQQKGPSMWVQVAKGPQLGLLDDRDLGTNWSSYPHADAVVRSMNATSRVRLRKGEHYLFATVFHGRKTGTGEPWKLNFTQGYNGVALSNGQNAYEVQLAGNRVELKSAPGVTTFESPQSTAVAKGSFQPRSGLAATPTAPAPVNLADRYNAQAFRTGWTLSPAPHEMLLSGNSNQPGALKQKAVITANPAPQAGGNVLDKASANQVEALLDGEVNNTGQAVMFPVDREVSLVLDFHNPSQVSKIRWDLWWAQNSSQRTAYLLDNAKVELSNDAFAKDIRAVGTLQGGQHPDWGTPVRYEVDAKGQTARYVRLTLKPRAGSAIYLAEINVYGKADKADVTEAAYTFSQLTPARLQKNAAPTLLASTREGLLLALTPAGKEVWSKIFPNAVNGVAAGDVDGDGVDEIAIARQDGYTTLLTADGKELWSRQLQYYRRPPYVNLVRMGDLDGDGKAEIVVGGENWRFYAYDGTGKELWQFETVHPSRSGAIADLNGDGKQEVVAGTHYYTSTVLSHDGKRVWAYRLGPIAYDVATGNFDGNKTRGVVFGAGDGIIHYTDSTGTSRLKFDTGDEVRHVAASDLDGDGKDEILAASDNSYLYCFGADGKQRWLRYLNQPATAITAAKINNQAVVLVGTKGGNLQAYDATGKLVRNTALGSAIREISTIDGGAVVATENGRLMRIDF